MASRPHSVHTAVLSERPRSRVQVTARVFVTPYGNASSARDAAPDPTALLDTAPRYIRVAHPDDLYGVVREPDTAAEPAPGNFPSEAVALATTDDLEESVLVPCAVHLGVNGRLVTLHSTFKTLPEASDAGSRGGAPAGHSPWAFEATSIRAVMRSRWQAQSQAGKARQPGGAVAAGM